MQFDYVGDEEAVAMLRLRVSQSEKVVWGLQLDLDIEKSTLAKLDKTTEEQTQNLDRIETQLAYAIAKSEALKERFEKDRKKMQR